MSEELREASTSQLFTGSLTPGLLLTTGWEIVAANDAYLAATGRAREDLLRRPLLDALPQPPPRLAESLESVCARRVPDVVPCLRYDMPGPDGGFLCRTWSVVNTPIFGDRGDIVGILHQIEDISALAREVQEFSGQALGDAPLEEETPAQDRDDLIRAVTTHAARQRAALERATEDHVRVAEALAAMAGAYGANARPDAQRGRRELWRRIIAEYQETGSYDWVGSVCRQASRIGEATAGAAVSASGPSGLPKVLAASDPWSLEVEQIQETTGEGPGVSARGKRLPVLVDDLRRERRWPVFTVLAGQAGATSVWAVPVTIRDVTIATMSLYGRRPAPWGRDDLVQAALLADTAATALIADLARLEDDAVGPVRLDRPADPSAMAAGMLSVQLGVPIDEASLRLRALAFSRGEALDVTALGVLAGTIRPD